VAGDFATAGAGRWRAVFVESIVTARSEPARMRRGSERSYLSGPARLRWPWLAAAW
jgi:hypothetical protein